MEIFKTSFYDGILIDVRTAERSNQWPFSCYGPTSENPNIPLFDDTSPEEVRAKFYEIKAKGGNLKEYTAYVDGLTKKVEDARKFLKNPCAELAKVLTAVQASKNPILTSKPTTDAFSSFKFDVGGRGTQDSKKSGIFTGGSTGNASKPNPSNEGIDLAPSSSQSQSSSIFGGSEVQQRQSSGVSPKILHMSDYLYSEENELSQEEMASFMAPTFSFGKVPTKPPPKSLC